MFYKIAIIVIVIFVITKYCFAQKETVGYKDISYSDFLQALIKVESDGNPNAIGDHNEAIGIFQVHYRYWLDAVRHDKTIGGTYEDCYKVDYAIKIVKSYFDMYAKQAVLDHDWEKVARIHQGGPNGWKHKKETENYWLKVKKVLMDKPVINKGK